ncbi:DUF4126 domain-containing protein [Moraxella canis]|uniref:DUF4126 domain-containing protein n=1 Tax=Moraxella canis TaxID=90239 RepID=UPI000667D737|nr:DUF4126 domain-containing protein [Moraxella canis]
MSMEMILSICLGIGLAASTGFRVFVPLFGLSIAAHFGIIPLSDSWQWLGSLSALVILGVASVVESMAYLIPFVDNLLDTIAVPLAGVAGTLVMASTLTEFSPAMTWALAIVAGGGAAATIKTTSAATRAVSTATTAGSANPAIGMAETGAAIGLSAVSILFPVVGMMIAVIGIIALIWIMVRLKRQFAK